MKNTIKKILCAALALIMVIGAVPAFAVSFETEVGDMVSWTVNEYGDGIGYKYGGAIFEGTNKINTKYDCFGFDAEKTGYYLLSNVFFVSAEVINDEPYYDATLVSLNDTDSTLVYLDAEEDVFVAAGNGDTIEIEYMGEGIADIGYDANDFKDTLYGEEVHFNTGKRHYIYVDGIQIEFTNGRKINNSGRTALFFNTNEIVNGENTVEYLFPDYELEQIIEVYYIDYYIEDVELHNKEKYLALYSVITEDFMIGTPAEWPDIYTVYFTDGTSETVCDNSELNAEVILPNGKAVEIGAWYCYGDTITLEVGIGSHTYHSYECKSYGFGLETIFVFVKNIITFYVDAFTTMF